jgi:hypothetical protein
MSFPKHCSSVVAITSPCTSTSTRASAQRGVWGCTNQECTQHSCSLARDASFFHPVTSIAMPIAKKYFQIPDPMAPTPVSHRPTPPKPRPKPLLRLEVRDLSEEGARSFLSLLDCANVLQEAVDGVLSLLYTSDSQIPPTRSVTLVLRSMGGVAYTTGTKALLFSPYSARGGEVIGY